MRFDTKILTESLVLLSEAGKCFPGEPCRNTVRRWTSHGANGVILAVARSGHFLYTSREEVARFLAAQNSPRKNAPTVSTGQRSRKSEAAATVLEASGV